MTQIIIIVTNRLIIYSELNILKIISTNNSKITDNCHTIVQQQTQLNSYRAQLKVDVMVSQNTSHSNRWFIKYVGKKVRAHLSNELYKMFSKEKHLLILDLLILIDD